MHNLLRRLDLTSLRLFVAVCKERNIARAAEREFIAPSAVSRRIADIETLIGLPLLQRQPRGIAVTPAGETLRRHAEAIIANVEALGAELSHYVSGARGTVRIAANVSSMVQFLPEDIAAFQRQFPEIRIELEEHYNADVLRLVEEHAVDFGICLETDASRAYPTLPYRADRLALAVPGSHPLAGSAEAMFADVAGLAFIGLRDGSTLMRQLSEAAEQLGHRLDVKFRVSSLDAVCRMVHVGLGIAVVPQLVGELYLPTLDLAVVPLADDWARRRLVLAYRTQDQLTAAADTLIRFLTAEA